MPEYPPNVLLTAESSRYLGSQKDIIPWQDLQFGNRTQVDWMPAVKALTWARSSRQHRCSVRGVVFHSHPVHSQYEYVLRVRVSNNTS